MMVESVGSDVLGQRLKRIRTRSGLSMRELAEIANVSKNTILRLEQGLPTHVSSIVQICKALRIKAEEITAENFEEPAVVAVHKLDEHVWYDMNSRMFLPTDMTISDEERLRLGHSPGITAFSSLKGSNTFGGSFSAHIVELFHPAPPRSHRGEEFVFVLQGKVRMWVAGQYYDLLPNESIYFYAAEVHYYEPIGDDLPARLLSVINDPYPDRPGIRNIVKK